MTWRVPARSVPRLPFSRELTFAADLPPRMLFLCLWAFDLKQGWVRDVHVPNGVYVLDFYMA